MKRTWLVSSGKNTSWNICVVLLWIASTSMKCGGYLRAPFLMSKITSTTYEHISIKFMYLVDFSSRCWQSNAIGKRATLDCKNMLISLNNMLLQGKRPHVIQSNSHPLSSLVLSRFSVSCLTIWQYTSSFKGSCM